MGKVVKGVSKFLGSVFKAGLGLVGMLFTPKAKVKATSNVATETRLNASLVPEEPFKIIFGETACAVDMRFWESYGTGNNNHVQVFAAACHELTSFGNLYLDERPVSFTGENATGEFAGVLTRKTTVKGVSGAGVVLGSTTRWTATSSMTGCAWFALIWNYDQTKLQNGIPSRITQVVKGAKVYDPRRDTTRGGSGAHRADNPATWEYLPTDSNGEPIGRNNALQMLAYTLGIQALSPVSGLWVVRAGRGASPDDIDFATFIAAANACEVEGWYSDCILSDGDSHGTNEGILEAAAGGKLTDTGGRFSYYVSTDDTATIDAYFTDSDLVDDLDWQPQRSMNDQYNELPGTFVDPAALFQTRPLPLCFSTTYYTEDGYKKRAEPEKLSAVQSATQGQKLLRRKLNRSRFQGELTASFNLKGLQVQYNSIIALTLTELEFVNKLFRVVQHGIDKHGGVALVLEEESTLIYAATAPTTVPTPSVGEGGDRLAMSLVLGLTATASGVLSGTSARDAILVSFTAPDQNVASTEGRYKRTADADWSPLPPLSRGQTSWMIEPLLPSTAYTIEARHITQWQIPGTWASAARTTNAVTVNPAGQLVYSNGVTVESLRPGEAGANVTETRTSLFIANQSAWATATTIPISRVNNLDASGNLTSLSNITTRTLSLLTGRTADQLTYVSGGATVESLRPGEAGANVTETRTALLISGQGSLATRSNVNSAHLPLLNAANDWTDEDFVSGLVYPVSPAAYDTTTETTVTMGIVRSIKSKTGNGSFTPSQDQLSSVQTLSLFPVTANQQISLGCKSLVKAGFTGLLRCYYQFVNVAGTGTGSGFITIVDRRSVAQVATTVYDSELTPVIVPANSVAGYFVFFVDWSSSLANAGYALLGKFSITRSLNFSSVTGATRPSDNAGSVLNLLISGSDAATQGNTISRIANATGTWGAGVYSYEWQRGSAYASVAAPNPALAHATMFGLADAASKAPTYANLRFGMFLTSAGNIEAYESNVGQGVIGTYATGDHLYIAYDGVNVVYYKNGTALRTVATTANRAFYFQASFGSGIGASLTNIQFEASFQAARIGVNTYNNAGNTLLTDGQLITANGTAAFVAGQGPLTTLTPPSYAGNTVAFAALGAGKTFINTSDSNKLASTFDPALMGGFGTNISFAARYKSRSGAGVVTTDTTTITPFNAAGNVTYSWVRTSGSAAITATSGSAATTAFTGTVAITDVLTAVFTCTISDGTTSVTKTVNVTIAEIT